MTVVTPDGKLVVANECQNSDLFWALRGGGGGTFGVLNSATLKTFPTPKISFSLYTANLTTKNTDIFWDAVADLFTELPRMMDDGLMGYLYVFNYADAYSFALITHMVDQSPKKMSETLAPVVNKMNTTYKADFGVSGFKVPPVAMPTFWDYWTKVLYKEQPLRPHALFPSRLIPKASLLKEKKDFIKQQLPKAGAKGHTVLAVGIVAGKGVAQHADNDVAANPAWRKAYLHMCKFFFLPVLICSVSTCSMKFSIHQLTYIPIVTSVVFPNEEPQRSQAFSIATDQYEQALIDLAPDSGAYLNEANPHTKNPGKTFFGKNYPRLLSLKKKIDPKGVFYCRTCVGSENYVEKDGAVCQKSNSKRDQIFSWLKLF